MNERNAWNKRNERENEKAVKRNEVQRLKN